MAKTIEKITGFCKEHKKEIIIGTATTAVCIVGCVLLGKKVKAVDIPETVKSIIPKSKDLPLPEKSVGEWISFWIDGSTKRPTAVICDVPFQYMGDLGAEILDHCAKNGIPQVVFDTPVQMVLEIGDL